MDALTMLTVIKNNLDEIKRALGEEKWREFARELMPLQEKFQKALSKNKWNDLKKVTDGLGKLCQQYPAVWKLVSAAPLVSEQAAKLPKYGPSHRAQAPTDVNALAGDFADLFTDMGLSAQTVTRYPDINFPGQVEVNKTYALKVAIVTEKRETANVAGDAALTITFEAGKTEVPLSVVVITDPALFKVEGDNRGVVRVPMGGDSAPAVFNLIPQQLGKNSFMVEFYQDNTHIGTSTVTTEVVQSVANTAAVPAASTAGSVRLQHKQEPPDLTIRVQEMGVMGDKRFYMFILLSSIPELDLYFQEAGRIEFAELPTAYIQKLYGELNQWARGKRNQDEIHRKMAHIGADLYTQLFSPELKEIYWKKIHGKVENIQIISSEPWIPWEMVKPWRKLDDGTVEEDNFLCEEYILARWLAGPAAPDALKLQNLSLVLAPADLQAVAREADAIRKVPNVQVQDIQGVSQLWDLLETGGTNAIHIACHGKFNEENPEMSIVRLGSEDFHPHDVAGKATTFGKDEPIVFINACEVGQLGFSMTGLGGWAQSFIAAGSAAFIGSKWEATDQSAYMFADKYYNELAAGKTIGEAVRAARQHIRDLGDPTWLSYSLYAHPLARIS